ncbi:MAG TPA: ADP-ribosylglycohydrolase family protein, partial [Acidimicrobiales bacterium]|nr:ADP-ribosylglycohydrolase family protein [Acidimicrobiales bacterium]
MDLRARLAGTLLGTALGDALGLPCEGMSARRIARRFGRADRFRLLGRTGYVSDDTEKSALVAQSLARFPADPDRCARAFRRSLVGWFWRLPWGVGLATVRSCFRTMFGFSRTGVGSAGNGSAMRAAVVGAFFHDRPAERRRFGEAIARSTHTDERAVQGALFVAELAAAGPEEARTVVTHEELAAALDRAADLARRSVPTPEAAGTLRTTGYVVHTVSFALYCYLRYGATPLLALQECVAAGGDTDSIAAILGAWLGARHGEPGLPAHLLARIHDGPFGPTHLRALAASLADGAPPPRYSWAGALLRNLALYPVVLAHGFRRI